MILLYSLSFCCVQFYNLVLGFNLGYTALHVAAAWGQLNAVKALIAGGSDHSLKNQNNETARDMAQRYGKLECVVYLDRSGKYHMK